ncbi:N-acyl homoserine lactonase family protein [Burkholderia multivorans]|nr:N-acyl homoserine lactonase family protein [Burkholderia multivorans]
MDTYEVYSLRYGTVKRLRRENFLAGDEHETATSLDYYVWVIRGGGRVWLVDTGFNQSAATQRKRELLRCPIESLSALGIQAADVSDVIITHLHYDHAGNLDKLPSAQIHIQEREVQYATGRHMCHDVLRHSFSVEDVVELVRRVYVKRVRFYSGDTELAPGLQLLHIGGHTDGLQAVRVNTKRGWVVLASDAVHYYDNLLLESPYPQVFNVGDMMDGHRKLMTLVDGIDNLIPGHDPAVHLRFPALAGSADCVKVLHEAPIRPLDNVAA